MKQGAKVEGYKLAMMAQMSLGGLRVADVTSKAIATYRNERLAKVANSTVRSELSLIRRTLEYARREWGFELAHNPAALVTLPPPGMARDRRLQAGEYEALRTQLANHPLVWAFVQFAIETAMRRGEILGLTWRHVNLTQRTVHLPLTKNGKPRTVPLTDGALEVLEKLPQQGERVFPIDISALRWAWTEACRKADLKDLRLHDLRHEGVSRLFEMGLSVPEVQMISGHKTVTCLFRYTNMRPLDLARKLKGRRRDPDII
jgi:Site-specific recombinase XerD